MRLQPLCAFFWSEEPAQYYMDMQDRQEMIQRSLIEPNRLLELFAAIEDQLYKFPAIDAASFRRKVEHVVSQTKPKSDRD